MLSVRLKVYCNIPIKREIYSNTTYLLPYVFFVPLSTPSSSIFSLAQRSTSGSSTLGTLLKVSFYTTTLGGHFWQTSPVVSYKYRQLNIQKHSPTFLLCLPVLLTSLCNPCSFHLLVWNLSYLLYKFLRHLKTSPLHPSIHPNPLPLQPLCSPTFSIANFF